MPTNSTTKRSHNFKDLTGQRFTRLLVLSYSHTNQNQNSVWNCLCDCGTECKVIGKRLLRGAVMSCGCMKRERMATGNTTHNLRYHPMAGSYYQMITRCTNPNSKSYHNYGGRGIIVCDRWRHSLANFIADMGDRPEGATLDRIDNDGPYSPENCRWATIDEQARNKRCNHLITYNGETLIIRDWELRIGLPPGTLRRRIDESGWSIDRAMTIPIKG